MINPNLRNYRIPTYADIPRTEVILVESHDSVGPDGVEGHRGVVHQPGGAGAGQRAARCHRRAVSRIAAHPRADLRPTRLDQVDCGQTDERMDTKKPTDNAATVIIGQQVRAGSEQEFVAWQQELNESRLEVPGIHRRGGQSAHRRATRLGGGLPLRLHRQPPGLDQQRHPAGGLAAGEQYFDGPATQQVIGGGAQGRPTTGHRRRDPPREPGERRRFPCLAGSTSVGGE